VKFRDLLNVARDLDADCMATGHYIRREMGTDGPELHRAADHARDQSYFLFSTTPEQLSYLRFPLGGLSSKAETRALATRYGLPVADKPDSQDICFVPNGNYASVIEKLRPGAAEPGDIVDHEGRTLGRHDGVLRYTVGQRRGLGIGGLEEPLFVIRLDADKRQVVVGPRELLLSKTISLREVNWLGDGPLEGEREVLVRVRSTRQPVPALLRPVPGGAEVTLLLSEEGVAPGQACVFYAPEGTRVLGGGWIARAG
jgi:tRNA-specific 2-thiouridylase